MRGMSDRQRHCSQGVEIDRVGSARSSPPGAQRPTCSDDRHTDRRPRRRRGRRPHASVPSARAPGDAVVGLLLYDGLELARCSPPTRPPTSRLPATGRASRCTAANSQRVANSTGTRFQRRSPTSTAGPKGRCCWRGPHSSIRSADPLRCRLSPQADQRRRRHPPGDLGQHAPSEPCRQRLRPRSLRRGDPPAARPDRRPHDPPPLDTMSSQAPPTFRRQRRQGCARSSAAPTPRSWAGADRQPSVAGQAVPTTVS